MTAPAIRYVRTKDNSTVSYTVFEGNPPAFINVGPCGGVPLSLWSRLPALIDFFNEARDGHQMYCVELRGSGLSGPLQDGPPIPQWENDIEAVIDLALGPVHLHSHMGACHAVASFAARAPGRVLSLLMSAPLADSLMPTAGFIPFFEADFRAAAEWHLQAFMAPGRGSPISELAAEWERLWSRTTFCRLAELNETASLRETLPGVNVPVLLMGPPAGWGEDLERTASLHPGARIAYTSGYPIDAAAGREFREVCKGFWSAAGLSNDVPADAPRPDRSLSSREEEVLRLLAEGKANKEIAAALSLSQATVASHVRHVLEKTGSANRAQAVAWAIRNGLI